MEEEVVDYLYKWALSDGFKKSKEDFVKLLQTNDEVLSYAFEFAQKDGFKKDKNALGALVGRTTTAAPVATAEPATTEPTTTTPATTEPAKTEVVAEDPVKELSNKPLEVVKAQGIPQREAEMPTADTTKMPPMVVKEAEPEVKEEPKKEMPIGENLLPVTEKTEVKAVETPSDKMVIKSEKKEEPMKVMTEKEKKEWQCPPAEGGCPKNKDVVHNYFNEKYKDKDYTPIIDREGNLAKFIDDGGRGVPITEYYGRKSYTHDSYGFTYSAEELPKSERFSVYNVPIEGKETSVIYDNKTGVILKDTKDAITTEDGKQMKTWLDVPTNNPEYQTLKAEIDKAKGGTTAPKVSTVPTLEPWQQPIQVKEVTEQPKMEVKEVTKEEPKMVIKSEKKTEEVNQKTPTFSKPIIINGAKFDDDMNLMRTFRPSRFEEYKELSKLAKPVDKSLDEIAQSFSKHFESIQLDRNISLSFPDPPNAKKKSVVTQNTENIFEDKIDNKNVYSYYDEKNKKWYIYNKEKDENNWNEVTSPQIKTVLNTKYKNNSGEIDKSKIFKTEEAEADKIIKIKEYYYYNKYLPTLIENWDNLKENQKESIKKDLNVLLMKRLSRDMYHKEKYKEEIKDIKERIKRNETVDEIDMNILKFGNPDERYDKFWEYVVEKTGAGDEELKALIKKYKK